MIKILIANIEISKNNKFFNLFSSYRLQKIEKANSISVINEYKAAENILIYGLKKFYNININKPLNILTSLNGKPYFNDNNKFPKFSISHSHQLIGIAFSFYEVGFDLQKQVELPQNFTSKLMSKPFFNNTNNDVDVLKRFVMLEAKAKLTEKNILEIIESKFKNVNYKNGKTNYNGENYFYSICCNKNEKCEIAYVTEEDFEKI